jgi:2-C-methyl-D-erythritol 4-phosphate cytidylyltransferase
VSNSPKRIAVILAAGAGNRIGAGINKVWLPLGGQELLTWSFKWLIDTKLFYRYVLVVHPTEHEKARSVLRAYVDAPVDLVDGGITRHDSERHALEYLAPAIEAGECDLVLIHDGARPLTSPQLITEIVKAAETYGGAVPSLPTSVLTGHANQTGEIIRVQTPQVFKAQPLLNSYRKAEEDGFQGSDTAMCIEQYAPELEIMCVPGSAQNIKVTYAQDLILAEHILASHHFNLHTRSHHG